MKSTFRRGSLKYTVNEKFFDKWSSQMAYILGFTYSDGNIYKNSLAWDIQKRDKILLIKIKKAMNSTYPIAERPNSFRLRMTNQKLNESIARQGIIENKAKRMSLPQIPDKYLSHFVRGFLDGDGWITLRNGRNEADLGFVSGNKRFMENLSKSINSQTNILGRVRQITKITPKGVKSTTYLMEYYSNNAVKVGEWIYSNLKSNDIFLVRKHRKFLRAVKLYKYLFSGSRGVRVIQRRLAMPMSEILNNLYTTKHFDGEKIAKILKVHSSSIYRWLERYQIRYPVHRNISYE